MIDANSIKIEHLEAVVRSQAEELERLRGGTMSIERAKAITAQCLRNCMSTMGVDDDKAPLPDCSLEEMLIANRLVAGHEEPWTTNPDGSTSRTVFMTVDPRGIAAAYALANFGGDPRDLLDALGFRVGEPSEDE